MAKEGDVILVPSDIMSVSNDNAAAQHIKWALTLKEVDAVIKKLRLEHRDVVISKPTLYEEKLPDGEWQRFYHFRVVTDGTSPMQYVDIRADAFKPEYTYLEGVVRQAFNEAVERARETAPLVAKESS